MDNRGRINTPGTVENNWVWRMQTDALTAEAKQELLLLTQKSGRFNWKTVQEKKEKPQENSEN